MEQIRMKDMVEMKLMVWRIRWIWLCDKVRELEWIYDVRISYDGVCVRIIGDKVDVIECYCSLERI